MGEISVPALRNAATQLRIDSVRSTSEAGSGHPTTCLSAAEIVAALFFAEMRYDPQGPAESRQRSLRAVEGTRRADSLRRLGRGRPVSARGAAEAAPHRLRSRRASDAAAVVRRRRHRLARPGDLRRRSAPRSTRAGSSPTTAPTCCSATARWLKARSGKRPIVALHYKLDNLCGIIDVNGLGQSQATQFGHDMDADRRAAGRRSAGTRSSSTATTSRRCWTRSTKRATTKAGRR